MFGFGSKQPPPPPPPKTLNQMSKDELKTQQREMQRKLTKEMREIDKQILQTDQDRKKAEQALQKECKKGDKADKFIKQTYARQVITCQKNKERALINKGKIQGLGYSLDQMFADIRMAQTMGAASNVMKHINQIMNIKELSATMQDMQKQFIQMGMMQESMDEALENVNNDVDMGDLQEEADRLINQTEAQLAGGEKNLPQQQQQQYNNPQQLNNMDDIENRLQQL